MVFSQQLLVLAGLLSSAASCLASNQVFPKSAYVNHHRVCDISTFPPLIEATLDDLKGGLECGLFTSVDLVKAYTARIYEVNGTLHMVTQLNPDAIAIAEALDIERAVGLIRGPLHGIPILIKNNIATHDKMDNTAGSYALLGAKVPEDSTMAKKLRKAGAVILGKTNLSQWANYRSFNTSNGWSALGGQTMGAYYPGQDPSGSSSGSGVASSLGLALAALGTETDGSILSPSDVNNLVGIKPSVGLTSRHLVVPISEHQDTVGPMARTVKDAAYLLTAIAGRDVANDNYTSANPHKKPLDYVKACKRGSLKGKRIGVPRNYIDLTGEAYYQPVVDVFDSALDVLRKAGAEVIDNITLVADLQNFTHEFPLEDWPERDTLVWEGALELGYGNTSPEFWSNYTADLYYAGPLGITGALKNYSLDALVVPTAFAPFLPALIGSPVVTVPLGKFDNSTLVRPNGFGNLNATAPNLPFGFSFMGERFSEYELIGYAYAFEQRTMVRNTIKPYIQPKTELIDIVGKR